MVQPQVQLENATGPDPTPVCTCNHDICPIAKQLEKLQQTHGKGSIEWQAEISKKI